MRNVHNEYGWQMADLPGSRLDFDLRLVRYFTVVAEHGNFARAAAALHLAQPSLSRQIQRLEKQLGARLLDRTPQGSRLTDAGRVFLPQAHALLRSAHHAATTTRAAARPSTITIGYTGSLIVTPAVRELRRRYPDAEVHTLHLDWNDVHTALLDRRVDAAVTREPFPTDNLRVTVLYDEPRVLLVPTFHRLAGKESVTLDDIADEVLVRYPDPAKDAFWRIDPRPDGRPAPDGPLVETLADKLEQVAGGLALALAPAGDQHSTLRHDLTTVPIEGIEPCKVVLATRANDRSHLVAAFRDTARTHLAERT
jgi:DNA-binding transcriptional LysR family regulator